MDKALLAVGSGFTDLGRPDPRKQAPGSERNHPVLTAFLKRFSDEDDPATRSYSANVLILEALFEALNTRHPEYGAFNEHAIDLVIVAFYWLLRPAEYLHSEIPEARSQAFFIRHAFIIIDATVYFGTAIPLNDVRQVTRISFAALTFTDQKNAVRGETVGHAATSHPRLCPSKALGRILIRHKLWGTSPAAPLHHHYNDHPNHRKYYPVKSQHVTNALRHAGKYVQRQTGIDLFLFFI